MIIRIFLIKAVVGRGSTQCNEDIEVLSWAVAENDMANSWSPGLWSKFDWVRDSSGDFFYCQSAYDAASEQDAIDTISADISDFETGCSGFSWTALRASLAIRGSYTDNWGSSHTADAWKWMMDDSVFHVSVSDNWGNWLVAQNDSNNAWNQDLWSKFEWTWDSDGGLYYCQTAYAEASESDAINFPAADTSDMQTGCGGFGWSQLSAE